MVTGGDKMNAFFDEMLKRLSTANSVKAGFLEGPTYPDGTPVPVVAAVQEFGDRTTPARPFMRPARAADGQKWQEFLGEALAHYEFDAKDALDEVGLVMQQSISDSLRKISGPPLAASTIAEKHSAVILIDTGKLLDSIDSKVE